MTQRPTPDERRPPNQGPKAAARNRAALIVAAREVYAEHGLHAPLSLIARRAGVGQGVLYRHFPDRAAISTAVLEENVRQVEEAAAAENASLPGVLGVMTWHVTESAAFIGILLVDSHGEGEGEGPGEGEVGGKGGGRGDDSDTRTRTRTHALALSERVERALRGHLPDGHPLAAADDLMLAVSMVSGAATGHSREERERRALASWRLLGVEVGPVRPFQG
ncbi:helix-turn-helix domain-containing protein [Streptomyces geranii]|uniref:helix-turn-helix domain-containing protein n=1 Tax=Streptomyces geranii TaxID=2058923 RepID=UPI000D02EE34|nr:TetR/AcrR family transcriptional regulator [Streptomyces geranii]